MNAGMLTTSINLAIAGDSSFVSSFTLAANPSTHTQIQPLTHTHTHAWAWPRAMHCKRKRILWRTRRAMAVGLRIKCELSYDSAAAHLHSHIIFICVCTSVCAEKHLNQRNNWLVCVLLFFVFAFSAVACPFTDQFHLHATLCTL